MQKRERRIRARAIKVGDELWHDFKWWPIKEVTGTGVGLINTHLQRGSIKAEKAHVPASVVRILRPVENERAKQS
jgi:hypothetical protein